jgi:hypothetical protein
MPAEGLYLGRLQGSFFDIDTGKIVPVGNNELNISTHDMLQSRGVEILAADSANKFLGKFGKILLHDPDKQTDVIMSKAAYKKGLEEESRKHVEKEIVKAKPQPLLTEEPIYEKEYFTETPEKLIDPYEQRIAAAKARLAAIREGKAAPGPELTLGKPISGGYELRRAAFKMHDLPSERASSYQDVLDRALEASINKLIELWPMHGQPGYEGHGFYETVVVGITFDARSKLGQEMRLFQSRHPDLVNYTKKDRYQYQTYIDINFSRDSRVEKITREGHFINIPSKMEVECYKAFVKIVQDARISGSEAMEAKVIRVYSMN